MSAITRRMMSTAAREINWSSPVFKSAELAPSVTQFKGWVASAEAMAENYSSKPSPIEFDSYKKKIRDNALVSNLESFYKSTAVPPEVHVWSDEDRLEKVAQIEEARKLANEQLKDIEETENQISFLKENYTTRETSVGDMMEVHPDIAEEVEQEIVERKWFADVITK